MFCEERNLLDSMPVSPAEAIEHAIAGHDSQPGNRGGEANVHMVLGNQVSGSNQRDIFRKRQPQSTGKQQREKHGIAAPFEPAVNVLKIEEVDKSQSV